MNVCIKVCFCFSRFEMPYNIWCNGCGKHIGMGKLKNNFNSNKCPINPDYRGPFIRVFLIQVSYLCSIYDENIHNVKKRIFEFFSFSVTALSFFISPSPINTQKFRELNKHPILSISCCSELPPEMLCRE